MKKFKLTKLLAGACLSLFISASPRVFSATVVDVLVLYTPEALQTREGADIDARISSYIAYANQAYINSNVDMTLRLVGSELLNAPYRVVSESNLNSLRQNAEVAQLRRKYGADLVTVLNLRQETSGGYMCGIGYVPTGDGRTGKLYSNASSTAFSLVGINCGLSTMAHELGHNMSLGHSHVQGSGGGVWSWARGHGVQGLFSTIMAYPQSYGTRNQLPMFANPAVKECAGLACGVDKAHSNGADAASSLNLLATQIANFMPTVVEVDNTDNGGGISAPPCEKNAVDGNVLVNGEFDSLSGWRSGFNLSTLALGEVASNGCVDSVLLVTNRSQYYSGAFQSLSGKLRAGVKYQFDARLGIRGGSREDIRVALQIQDATGNRYAYLEPVSVTSSELTAVTQAFSVDSDGVVGILIYGPPAGVDIVVDSVSIMELAASDPQSPDQPTENAAVIDEQFELSANGWQSYSGGTLSYSANASTGSYSLLTNKRTSRYSGPSLNATGALEAGGNYRLSAAVQIAGTFGSRDNVQVWLYYVDNGGGHWQSVANTYVALNAWHNLEGEFAIASEGEIVDARLIVVGPYQSRSLYLDDLVIERL